MLKFILTIIAAGSLGLACSNDAPPGAGDGGPPGVAVEPGPAAICTGCVYDPIKSRTDCASASSRCKGTCGAGCKIQCGMGAACDVTVTAGGAVECDTGAIDCKITVADPKGSAECTGGVACSISCTGACQYVCKKAATCSVACGGTPAMSTMVDGMCK